MKRPAFLGTYVLVALVAAFGAWLVLVESKRDPAQGEGKEKVFAGLAGGKDKVKEVTLARGGETIQLVKGSGGWRLAAPQSVEADAAEVDSLLSSLESLEVDEVVSETPGELGRYGLAPPRGQVTLVRDGSSDALRLQVGDKTPDGRGVYSKLPTSGRVFTIPAGIAGSLEKSPFDLRDRRLLRFQRDEVKTLEVKGPSEGYALARDAGGEWAFTRPLPTRAGRWSVDGLLGTLEGLRMERVAAEDARDLQPYGLADPVWRVSLGLADGTTRGLEIGGSPADKQYHARQATSRLVAVIPGAVVEDLGKGMKELRSRRLLDVAAYEVEGFEVAAAGGKRAYARSSSKDKDGADVFKWKRTAPQAADLDT
ncbi:MAG TPA: DUF4340 domain-containing protein, partial [Vicinamibacteria bacterium]|nr:DUF4340 domain-containing protein [Vicinamibacteria bacterium]